MALSTSAVARHSILRNSFLIVLSVIFAPLCTFVSVASWIVAPYLKDTKHIHKYRRWRRVSSSTFRPRTVLVTGVETSTGLALSRIFYRAGHRVTGAYSAPHYVPIPGHFSSSIETVYKLSSPENTAKYILDLISLIKKEKIELWISCSAKPSTLIDAEAAEVIEQETNCKIVHFGVAAKETLYNTHSFIQHAQSLDLPVPESHLVTSENEALVMLYSQKSNASRFIMKRVQSSSHKVDLTRLPLPSPKDTQSHVKSLGPSPFRPFLLQQYIPGTEYCTYALVINSRIRAFVACPSATLPMHYQPLPNSSLLSQAMLRYTALLAKGAKIENGHVCLNILADAGVAQETEGRFGAPEVEVKKVMEKLCPISYQPTPNPTILCFRDAAEDLADAYLSVLRDHEPKGVSNGHRVESLVVPKPGIKGYYWVGYDIVTRVLLPTSSFLRRQVGWSDVLKGWADFAEQLLFWRDGMWEVWDPWPFWWFYVGYWPLLFALAMWERRKWERVNITTCSFE